MTQFFALPIRYNSGKLLVKEVGHWLGLLNIYTGGCSGYGDGIADTPFMQRSPFVKNGCPQSRDSCPDKPGKDLLNNFMDHTKDSCRNSFTEGQFETMKKNWYENRHNNGLGKTSYTAPSPVILQPTATMKPFTSNSELSLHTKEYCINPHSYDTTEYG